MPSQVHLPLLSAFVTAPSHSWIIDSGASDHMTGMSFFSSYSICFGKDKVKVVDESYSSIDGKGSVSMTLALPLTSILRVPNFTLNLLFVSHLTKSLNCCVFFFYFSLCISGFGDEDDIW